MWIGYALAVLVRVRRPDGTLEPPRKADLLRDPGIGDRFWLDADRHVEVRGVSQDADGRPRYLIVVEVQPWRKPDRDVLSTGRVTDLGVRVDVSGQAARAIVDRGGRLFLWQEPVGGAWLLDRQAYAEPPGQRRFSVVPVGLIKLLIADDVRLPKRIKISLTRLPPKRVRVEWDGRPWGARGDGGSGG